MLLFHFKTLSVIDWHTITLEEIKHYVTTPTFLVTSITSLALSLVVAFTYYKFRIDKVKQLEHRQKLALLVLQNGWYESEQVQSAGFFKDLGGGKLKEKITHFPKIYYRLKNGLIHINVEITMTRYQEQLLQLENKLESGLFCEVVNKHLKDSFVEYTLLYDCISDRIGIGDVAATQGKLKLMDSYAGSTTPCHTCSLQAVQVVESPTSF